MPARDVSCLNSLGPRCAEMLRRVGIHHEDDLRRADAIRVYLQVRSLWPGASLNLLYALIGAQEDRDWREIARERRTELLLALDDLGTAPRTRRPRATSARD